VCPSLSNIIELFIIFNNLIVIRINKYMINPDAPDWKNNNNQTYSCPRDLRLSASWGTLKNLLKPPQYDGVLGAGLLDTERLSCVGIMGDT